MIRTRKELQEYLAYEKSVYRKYMFPSVARRIMAYIKNEHVYKIYKWQRISRYADFYEYKSHNSKKLIYKLLYLYFIRKRNIMGEKLGLEISTYNTGKGLLIYHFNNVINGGSIIGDNCKIHGTVVIGNAGNHNLECPIIGNNVMIGAGARIIGNIKIADNIKIASGAVVVSSFLIPGITIGGIPARRLK